MSRLCRLKSYKNIGEDGQWAYNEIVKLRDEVAEYAELCNKLSDILSATAIALKGKEPYLTKHSFHDLSEVATTHKNLCDQLGEALQNCANNEDDVMLTRNALEAWRAMK
jgi:hypothetical protein